MGIEPIIVSAGELEHENAGYPAFLMRMRYGRAAEIAKNQGKLTALIIQDIDAGLGRFKNTQVTVNNQMVVATLMSLCDNPAFVSVGESWDKVQAKESKRMNRIPIIVTGNDFSTVFAPLVRDGRMEKFYWEPTREDTIMTVWTLFRDDGFSREDMERLVDTFPNQTMDFFGSVRQATYDDVIKEWVLRKTRTDVDDPSTEDLSLLNDLLVDEPENKPTEADTFKTNADIAREKEAKLAARLARFDFEAPEISLERLIEEGERLVAEQEFVQEIQLAGEYMRKQRQIAGSMIGFG